NDPDDARKLVNSAKYSPIGERGLSIFTRAGDYFKDGAPGHTDRQNDETVVIGHIEGKRGLDNLDEIMEVDGIDVYFLGPYDISQSLGIPGDVRNPIVEEALVEACGKARDAGKAVGSYARDIDMGRWLLSNGVQYLAYNVDATVYMEACERIMGELRA
ncbi:MAG: aldolase, partial [Chloroflexi bacterium]|nr:aldolase [Chloroflexota bacterium]